MLKISISFAILIVFAGAKVGAQTTVGNATMTPAPTSVNEPYGVTSPFSRHQRLGNSTGIGGSTLDTESVTSESREAPALSHLRGPAATEPIRATRLRVPSPMQDIMTTPALSQPSFEFNANRNNYDLMGPQPSQTHNQSVPGFNFGAGRNPATEPINLGKPGALQY